MALDYIGPYLSSIPSAQRQQLVNLLNSKTQTGQIQSLDTYQSLLTQELAAISAFTPAPQFTLFKAPYRSKTNSANYNTMEQAAIKALGIAYNEVSLIDDAINNYIQLVEGTFESIESTLSKFEHQVDILEILANNTDGFVTFISDSFSEAQSNRLSRQSINSSYPWTIPSVGFIASTSDAVIDNGRLKLPQNNTTNYIIATTAINHQNPQGSSAIISSGIIASGIYNPSLNTQYLVTSLINNQPWAETVNVSNLNIPTANADLVVNLAGVQQINRIQIIPFTRYPYYITGISYTQDPTSNTSIDLPQVNFPVLLNTTTVNIEFPNIYANQIILHISQSNYSKLRYIENTQTQTIQSIFDLATGQLTDISSINNPNNFYYAMATNMQDLLDINPSGIPANIDTYEFLYGMNNIKFQKVQYNNYGIYVSTNEIISKPGIAGLETDQQIPSPNLASVQYDIIVQYQDLVNNIVTRTFSPITYPILPASISQITGELLYLQSNLSPIMHSTRFAVKDLSSIAVYQNGVKLPSTYYSIAVQTDKTVTITLSNTYLSQTTINTSNFTINYIPASSAYLVQLEQHDQAIINFRIFLQSQDPNKMLTPSIGSWALKFAKFGS